MARLGAYYRRSSIAAVSDMHEECNAAFPPGRHGLDYVEAV